VCQYTDANGRAAVEILNSDPEKINVIADFDPEGLLRSVDVNFGTPPVYVPPVPVPPTVQQLINNPPAGYPVPPAKPSSVAKAKKLAYVSYARLVKRHGKVYLVVKVKGNGHKYAMLRVKPLAKHGRQLGIWTKKVRTGKTLKIRVSAKAAQARVSLVR